MTLWKKQRKHNIIWHLWNNTKDWERQTLQPFEIALCQTIETSKTCAIDWEALGLTLNTDKVTVNFWTGFLTINSHFWDEWIYVPFLKTLFFFTKYHYCSKPRFVLCLLASNFLAFLIVLYHPSNHRSAAPISDWSVVWIKNTSWADSD